MSRRLDEEIDRYGPQPPQEWVLANSGPRTYDYGDGLTDTIDLIISVPRRIAELQGWPIVRSLGESFRRRANYHKRPYRKRARRKKATV